MSSSFAVTKNSPVVSTSSSATTSNACVGITNANTSYVYVLSGYTGGGAYCVDGCSSITGTNCYNTLSPNAQQAVTVPSGAWVYLQYDVCSGVTYDSSGQASCTTNNGYVGLTFTSSGVTVSSVGGGTASIGSPINGYYPITFTPAVQNLTFGVQNTTDYTFVFTKSSSDLGSSCDESCYATLAPGAQQFVTLSSNGGWINLQYNVCGDISYDPSGQASCSTCTAMGDFGVTCTNTGFTVSNQYDGTATAMLSSTPNVYNIGYTSTNPPCPLGTVIPTPQTYASIPYRGVNLAGCDFANFTPPCACDAVYFVNQGVNTIRLPVRWEYLQGDTPLGTGIDFSQGDALIFANLVRDLTLGGLTVLIDMHNYMRYNQTDPTVITGPNYIIGSSDPAVTNGPTADQYATAWASIATEFAGNALVMFDLMNEPNSMETELILSNYNAAIAAIRSAEIVAGGVHHWILLEGNSYSCMANWEGTLYSYGTPNSEVLIPYNGTTGIQDSANKYMINVHEYFTGNGGDAPTTGCGVGESNCVNAANVVSIENVSAFVSWLQANNLKGILTELNGIANANCAECVYNTLNAINQNPDTGSGGFVGWTGWSGGSFNTDYSLNLTPTYNGTTPTTSYQFENGFQPFLTPLP